MSSLIASSVSQVVKSAHPYLNSSSPTWTISGGDGVTRMRVHFAEVELEQDYDYLYVQDGTGKMVQTLNNYPAVTDLWSEWVVGKTITLNLSADGSVAKYGFSVDRYEAESTVALQGAVVTIQAGGQTVSTDANGLYRFVGVQPGDCTLTPSYTGLSFTPSTTVCRTLRGFLSPGVPVNGPLPTAFR